MRNWIANVTCLKVKNKMMAKIRLYKYFCICLMLIFKKTFGQGLKLEGVGNLSAELALSLIYKVGLFSRISGPTIISLYFSANATTTMATTTTTITTTTTTTTITTTTTTASGKFHILTKIVYTNFSYTNIIILLLSLHKTEDHIIACNAKNLPFCKI